MNTIEIPIRNSDKLIFSAFANNETANTGVNIKNIAARRDIYYKNIVVALVSAKKNNPTCDVALVSNQDVPPQYNDVLSRNNIIVINCPFESFRFADDYPWALAYYKLCALKKVLDFGYDHYLMIDSDVFVQNDIKMLWNWTSDYLVMFDTGETTERWQNEMHLFLNNNTFVTHWGGEFIAGSKKILKTFIALCEAVYNKMTEISFKTIHGDEFIESIAILNNDIRIKHADMFMYRFWTRTDYRVKTVLPVGGISVLHVPAEKEHGMLEIYKYLSSNDRIPSQKRAQRMLHVHTPTISVRIKLLLDRVINILK